jgi:predicted DsbA family dithiol-disulfide isomerase
MKRLQIFYDYECPFCKRGYEYLLEFIGNHPEIELEWRPVEAHPRPENHRPHTDLCLQSYYLARELGADMAAFHKTLFRAVAVERRNVESIDILADIVKDLVDVRALRAGLEAGKYAEQVTENNDLAYEGNGVWAVPAFRMYQDTLPVKKLDAVEGIGVTREQVRELLK